MKKRGGQLTASLFHLRPTAGSQQFLVRQEQLKDKNIHHQKHPQKRNGPSRIQMDLIVDKEI